MTKKVTVLIPGPCPYCGGKKFARLTDLKLTRRVVDTEAVERGDMAHSLKQTDYTFAMLMCCACGKSDLFCQNARDVVAQKDATVVELDAAGPYR